MVLTEQDKIFAYSFQPNPRIHQVHGGGKSFSSRFLAYSSSILTLTQYQNLTCSSPPTREEK